MFGTDPHARGHSVERDETAGMEASNSVTRRRILTGTVGAVLLAGCAESPTAGGGDGKTANGRIDTAFTVTDLFNPAQLQFNDFNPTNNATTLETNTPGEILYDRFLLYVPGEDKYYTDSFILDDWTFEGNAVTLTVSDKHKWHNGDRVTPRDVTTQWKLELYRFRATGDTHPYVSKVVHNDDGTVTLRFHDSYNEDLVLQSLFTRPSSRLVRKHSRYGTWLKRFQQASGQTKMQSVLSELQQQTFEKPLGNGPFRFTRRTGRTFETEVFEDHPSAKNINFARYEWRTFQSGQQELQAIRAGKIDTDMGLSPQPKSIMKQWPAGLDTPRIDIPTYGGRALWFNNKQKPFDDRRVRQAFAYLLDRKTITSNLPESHSVDRMITGVAESSEKEWFNGISKEFIQYSSNKKRGMNLLKEAGVSPNDLSVTIKTPPYADSYVPVARTVASQLKRHGISTSVLTQEPATYYSDISNSDFQMAVNVWGGDGLGHPYFSYRTLYNSTDSRNMQVPETYNVSPIGKPDGPTQTVDMNELLATIQSAKSKDQMTKPIRQLGWIVNYQLPLLPISEAATTTYLFQPSEWEYTPNNEAIIRTHHPAMTGPRLGFLKATQ